MSRRSFRLTVSTGVATFGGSLTTRGSIPVPSPPTPGYWQVEGIAAMIPEPTSGGLIALTIDYAALVVASPAGAAADPLNQQPVVSVEPKGLSGYRNTAANLVTSTDALSVAYQVTNSAAPSLQAILNVTLQLTETIIPGSMPITAAAGVNV